VVVLYLALDQGQKRQNIWIKLCPKLLCLVPYSWPLIAVFPAIIVQIMNIQAGWALFFGGTSLLIMVGVAIDTMQQVNSYLLNKHYDGLMKTGKNRKSA
jgi:preprotein translocase subunit SecY